MDCPICKQKLLKKYQSLVDDYYGPICESLNECPEGHYYEEYAYGYTTLMFSDGFRRDFSYLTSSEEVMEMCRDIANHNQLENNMETEQHTACEWNDILNYGIIDYDGFRDGDITEETKMTQEEFERRALRSTRILRNKA